MLTEMVLMTIKVVILAPMTTGENHRGYLGYRDNITKLLTNDGAINVVS